MADIPDPAPKFRISEAFAALSDLAAQVGVQGISQLPGCWTHQVDQNWWVAINGHRDPRHAQDPTGSVTDVPPYHAYLTFNGWPAGLVSPRDGMIAAGTLANEATFITAVRAAIERDRAARRQEVVE